MPGLPATLDFTTGPDDAACTAAGLRPLRGAAAVRLVVRYRGVGNNAVKAAFKAAGFRRDAPEPPGAPARDLAAVMAGWSALWGGQLAAEEYAALQAGQKVNHFPAANELGRKDRLARALAAAQARSGVAAFAFTPRTFCLPADGAAWAAEAAAAAAAQPGTPRLYIVKPPALSRGRGVHVCPATAVQRRKRLLVQRYIHPPHLLDGLKYDLRLYVCVTSTSPLRAYVHREGLVRFATQTYDASHCDTAAHVTNVSLASKDASAYEANQDAAADGIGHKWSLSALRRRFAADGVEWAPLWGRITDVIARTLIAAAPRMAPAAAESGAPEGTCFELYGFDVLLDGDLQPWLLEVNTGPNLAAPTPLDMHIKCRVAAEMLHLAGVAPPDAAALAEAPAELPRLSTRRRRSVTAMGRDEGEVEEPMFGAQAAGLAEAPLCVRLMVAEAGRCGGFERVFPSPDPSRNAQLLPLLSPPCTGAAAMAKYIAAGHSE